MHIDGGAHWHNYVVIDHCVWWIALRGQMGGIETGPLLGHLGLVELVVRPARPGSNTERDGKLNDYDYDVGS